MSERIETQLAQLGRERRRGVRPVNVPVTRASTLLFDSMSQVRDTRARMLEPGVELYGTFGTPVTRALEEAIASLDGAYASMSFSSGLAACTTAILAFVKNGDHILMTDSVYEPTRIFTQGLLVAMGVETTFYDPLAGSAIAELIRPNTRIVYTESPGSQTFEVQDIPAIAAAAHARGAIVVMDNTWATPLGFRAIAHGVDVVVHAATKYIAGHSDALVGIISATEATYPALRRMTLQLGHCLAADEAYLALRGLRTLSVRLERQAQSALDVAEWLQGRPEVARVLYPALPGDPGFALWSRDFLAASGVFSVLLKTRSQEAADAFLERLQLFAIGYSWGGFESLVSEGRLKGRMDWDDSQGTLVRLSIGLEHVEDLKADLARALEGIAQ